MNDPKDEETQEFVVEVVLPVDALTQFVAGHLNQNNQKAMPGPQRLFAEIRDDDGFTTEGEVQMVWVQFGSSDPETSEVEPVSSY